MISNCEYIYICDFIVSVLQKKKKKKFTPRALPPPPLAQPGAHPNLNHLPNTSPPTVLPPLGSPIPYAEETWMYPHSAGGGMGVGVSQTPTETYIEQHIVRRFSIPIVQGAGATPMPYPLHGKSVNYLYIYIHRELLLYRTLT